MNFGVIAMPENNITQTPESQLTPPLQQRGIGDAVLLASFIIGIITFVLMLLIGLGAVGSVAGCINFVIALPFILVTVLIYRKTQLSARFELLTALLVGGAVVIVGDLILSNLVLARVLLD
jgi:hypothetical protein